MRLDLVLPNEGPFAKEAVEHAPEFEAMGFDGLWLTDHVIGTESFQPVYGLYWLEILTAMTHIAARTSKVRIGAGVLVVPYRDPVVTAKIVATMDQLSGGRIDLGVGTGWAPREFRALGRIDVFEDRGPYTNEALDVMLTCWKGGPIEFDGRWFKFSKVAFEPKPLQGDRVPLWIGARGTAGPALRRAAKYADYWHPTGLTPEALKAGGEQLDEIAGRRVPRSIRGGARGAPDEIADRLHAYQEAGCVQAAVDLGKFETFSQFAKAAEQLYRSARALQAA